MTAFSQWMHRSLAWLAGRNPPASRTNLRVMHWAL